MNKYNQCDSPVSPLLFTYGSLGQVDANNDKSKTAPAIPEKERFEVPPGYIRLASGKYRTTDTKEIFDHPPSHVLRTNGLFIEDSD